MSLSLAQERCWTHPAREAAARCPSCTRSFCRECVTEHHGRLICAGCLRELRAASPARRPARVAGRTLTATAQACSLAASLLAAWFFFHLLAQTLIATPSEFHADTLWQKLGAGGGELDD